MNHNFEVQPEGDCQIIVTRDFQASVASTFAAMTEPELLKQWLSGPPEWSLTVCEDSLTVGSTFRFQWQGPAGELMTMTGVYYEFDAPNRIVREESFSFGDGPAMMSQRATLELSAGEKKDLTHLRITLEYGDSQARDGALASGMGEGMSMGYLQLDEVLKAN